MRDRLAVIALVAAALGLRLYGIDWGLPDSLHDYSYHPDEFLAVGAAASIIQIMLPGFYNYPSLYLYASALVILIAASTGLAVTTGAPFLCARLLTAAMGAAAVAVTFWAGRQLWGNAAGIIAAGVLCIAPVHVQHSHFATVDVPSTLFVAAAIGYAGRVLKGGGKRDYLLAGIMSGLAAGTKYNAGLVLLALIAAHFLRPSAGAPRAAGRLLLIAIGSALAAFIASTPGVILQWSSFWYGFSYEMSHAATGHGLVFAGTGCGFVYTFATSLRSGLGGLFALLFAAAVVYGLIRRDSRVLTVLAFVIPYYILISLSQVRFARYMLPLYPAIALLCGWMVVDVWNRLPKSGRRTAWAVVCIVSCLLTLAYTLELDSLFTGVDLRNRVARFVARKVRPRETIGLIDVPWFYSPPLSKGFGFGTLDQRTRQMRETPYNLVPLWEEPGAKPDWVIVSDFEIDDALRLRDNRSLSEEQRRQVAQKLAIYDRVQRQYLPVADFEDHLLLTDIGTRQLPHDMRYQSPTITVYRLKQ